jgi:hypothetical protein
VRFTSQLAIITDLRVRLFLFPYSERDSRAHDGDRRKGLGVDDPVLPEQSAVTKGRKKERKALSCSGEGGKTSQLCLVGQTVVQYFVKPVDCVAGGEGVAGFPPKTVSLVSVEVFDSADESEATTTLTLRA